MKAYVCWMVCHNYQVIHGIIPKDQVVPDPDELIGLPSEEICKMLCMFVMEVKNANGDYYRDMFYDLMVMVQAFLKKNRCQCKFFADVFFDLKNTIDNKMTDLSEEGKVAPCEKAEPISNDDEDRMWSLGILGDETPTKLVNTDFVLEWSSLWSAC